MLDRSLFVLTLVAVLGSGLIAGAFFAFSSFVMAALGKLPPAQGVAAMQSINVVVINRVFLGVFVGTAVLCLGLAAWALASWPPGTTWLLAAALLYVVGTFWVTMTFNVPHNDALAAVAADSSAAATLWSTYLQDWTAWNHVRTLAALAASALFALALASQARAGAV